MLEEGTAISLVFFLFATQQQNSKHNRDEISFQKLEIMSRWGALGSRPERALSWHNEVSNHFPNVDGGAYTDWSHFAGCSRPMQITAHDDSNCVDFHFL